MSFNQKLQRIPSTDTSDIKIAGLYDLGETIGKGHFAVVKLARHVFTGENVAVKVIDKNKLDSVSKEHLFQEVMCMKLVKHPNVVQLYEVIDTVNKLYLILELGDGGDLYDFIIRHECGLSEDLAKRYFSQVVTGIAYCHKLHVCHRDLKPENVVFFEKRGVLKLTDFGFSNQFVPGKNLDTSCGSLAYSAPEILLGDSYDATKVDIWSLGVILFMLVCGRLPFQEANDSETLARIMDCSYTLPAHLSTTCRALIAKLLQREPSNRAALDDILKDSWLMDAAVDAASAAAAALPLVARENICERDHEDIVALMVNGELGSREAILHALESDRYDHLTATYYLLAERRLRRRCSTTSTSLDLALNVHSTQLLDIASSCAGTTAEEKLRRFSMILEDENEELVRCESLQEVVIKNAASSITHQRSMHMTQDDANVTLSGSSSRSNSQRGSISSPTYFRRLYARRSLRTAAALANRQPSSTSRSSSDNSDTDHSSDTDAGGPGGITPGPLELDHAIDKYAPISEEIEESLGGAACRSAAAVTRLQSADRERTRDRNCKWRSRSVDSAACLTTQSNFSLCSLASSLCSNKIMLEFFRETLDFVEVESAPTCVAEADCELPLTSNGPSTVDLVENDVVASASSCPRIVAVTKPPKLSCCLLL